MLLDQVWVSPSEAAIAADGPGAGARVCAAGVVLNRYLAIKIKSGEPVCMCSRAVGVVQQGRTKSQRLGQGALATGGVGPRMGALKQRRRGMRTRCTVRTRHTIHTVLFLSVFDPRPWPRSRCEGQHTRRITTVAPP